MASSRNTLLLTLQASPANPLKAACTVLTSTAVGSTAIIFWWSSGQPCSLTGNLRCLTLEQGLTCEPSEGSQPSEALHSSGCDRHDAEEGRPEHRDAGQHLHGMG